MAPIARDSGARTPGRSIGGGRPYLRSMLYLAALQASRRCERFIAFRARLQAKGKTPKQAIIAVARKLLTILNAMLRTGTQFNPEAI
ncbi:transposase [Phaeobacter sp. JH20_36]